MKRIKIKTPRLVWQTGMHNDPFHTNLIWRCSCGSQNVYESQQWDYRECLDCGNKEGVIVERLETIKREKGLSDKPVA